MTKRATEFIEKARQVAVSGMNGNLGGPFGAVIVKSGQIIGKGCNRVTSNNDPTAHAEIEAIRDACSHINDFSLRDTSLYSTCEPCPMCLGAIYWARIEAVYFSSTRDDAADAGFDDSFIHAEIDRLAGERELQMIHVPHIDTEDLFSIWKRKDDKTPY